MGEVSVSIRENKLSLLMKAWMLLSFIRESLGLDPLTVEMEGGTGFAHLSGEFHLYQLSSSHLPGESLLFLS